MSFSILECYNVLECILTIVYWNAHQDTTLYQNAHPPLLTSLTSQYASSIVM